MTEKQNGATQVVPSVLLAALSAAITYPDRGLQTAIEPLRSCVVECAGAAWAARAEAVLAAADAFTAPGVEQPHGAEAAQLEYARLFIGSFKMYAPPYASYYLDGEHQVQGPTTMEIAALYGQFGLELDENEHDCADHIRYLLAFTALLARTYEERGQEEFAEAYRDFVELFILRWLPQLEQLVCDYAEFPFYPALVTFTGDVLRGEAFDA